MRVVVGDVIEAAEAARERGSVFLCVELLKLAEQDLAAVDHAATELSRLAVEAITERLPIGAAVEYAVGRAADRELRHIMLTTGEGMQ